LIIAKYNRNRAEIESGSRGNSRSRDSYLTEFRASASRPSAPVDSWGPTLSVCS